MNEIWTPDEDDNVFINELNVKIEALNARIAHCQKEKGRATNEIYLIKYTLHKFEKTLKYLKKAAFIVNVSEYKKIQVEIQKLKQNMHKCQTDHKFYSEWEESYRKNLQKLMEEKEKVKFKLLPFKKNDTEKA